jgi:gluconokinase
VKNDLYVVMGVAGSGKSVIGATLARSLNVAFIEGDDLHSAANVARMGSGIPLTDDDRRDWLAALAERIREAKTAGVGVVVTCSALKNSYRDVLRCAASDVQFIFLDGPRALIAERLKNRTGHYMPLSLLDSQFATLEVPKVDEHVWKFDIAKSPEQIVAGILTRVANDT